MRFYGGKEIAVEFVDAGSSDVRRRSARYARVLAEKELSHAPELCMRKKLIYVVDELGILLELTAVEIYDPHFVERWPLPRGRQRIVKARVLEVPPETRWHYVYGATCQTHGEYEVQAWTPEGDLLCGCCALEKILRFESLYLA